MTKEELLKPRYKVIADYPNSPYKVGDIYVFRRKLRNSYYEKVNGFSPTKLYYPEKYLHLFKKLEWWEERDFNEMPKYIKHTTYNEIGKVEKWDTIGGSHKTIGGLVKRYYWCAPSIEPATEEEYNMFMQKKK